MKIETLKREDEKLWDDFVTENDQTTFYHFIGWKNLIEKAYGKRLTPIYLTARSNGSLRGIFPIFLYEHRLFGKRLISLPFANCGGYCTESEEIDRAFDREIVEMAKRYDVDYVELRNREKRNGDWIANDHYFTLALDLTPGLDALWKHFRSTTRRYIRRSQENDLAVITESDDLDTFYRLYSQGQRNLGTPVIGYQWIQALFSNFPGQHSIAKVDCRGKTIAAVFLRKFKDTTIYVLGASLLEYRHLYPNYLLFWNLIRQACNQGFTQFEFGRSTANSGSYFFKEGWGAEPHQLHYQYYLLNAKRIPNTSQLNPKRKRLARVWRMLPLSVANYLGPIIRRYYP